MGARVFLSAVSSEFGAARRELRRDFGTRRMYVATQEELSHLTGAQSLLQLLENHIRDCTAVVCVIGSRSGAGFPTAAEAADYAGSLLQAPDRLGEAELLKRRVLAIDAPSYGEHHPEVAIDLNNLAMLMQTTNWLSEAEPLMRRHLAIFLTSQRDTGPAHPHCDAGIANYRRLLAAIGKGEVEIDAELAALWREAGLEPG